VGVGKISISVGIVAAGLGPVSTSGEGLAPPPQPAIKTTSTSIKIQESFFINSTPFNQYFMLFSQTLLYTPTFALSNAETTGQLHLSYLLSLDRQIQALGRVCPLDLAIQSPIA
jgi:hypothetical protein